MRNQKVKCVVSELDLWELFWKGIINQLTFRDPELVYEKTKKLLVNSREKHIGTVHVVIPRIFASLYIATKLCGEEFTHKTIADLGGISAQTVTIISDEIGVGLDIRHLW